MQQKLTAALSPLGSTKMRLLSGMEKHLVTTCRKHKVQWVEKNAVISKIPLFGLRAIRASTFTLRVFNLEKRFIFATQTQAVTAKGII